MASVSAAQFHENFWGLENKGYEVLLQNMKAGVNASRELGEFVKERIVVEDTYVKSLSKLQKSVQHIPENSLGTFDPLWDLLKTMCDTLVNVHTQFVKMLTDLCREIMDYNHSQKEKIKTNLRGDIELAHEALLTYQGTEGKVEQSKKAYLLSAEEAIKARVKRDKVKVDATANPKLKQKLAECEGKMQATQTAMNSHKEAHQGVVKNHCASLMEFQGKMSEACKKFESLEEEHVAQMVTFMIKIARTQDTTHSNVAEVFTILNSQLDIWTVENLLRNFVEHKGTGKEKPSPQLFREADGEATMNLVPVRTAMISRSSEDLSDRHGSKSDKPEKKGTFRPFSKRKKGSISSSSGGANGPAPLPISGPVNHEVDEEGYSIRPEDAANISKFPDDPWGGKKDKFSDSDTDSEEERENKIRKVKISEKSTQPVATIDDLKATVKTLKLGAITPPGMRKASSSQSLNILMSSSPVISSRTSGSTTTTEAKQNSESSQPSLLDLDTLFSSGPGGSQMPTPLKPTSSSSSSKTPHIAAPLLPSPPMGIRGSGASGSTSGSGPIIATTSFHTKHLDPSASLPAWSFSSPGSSSTRPSSSSSSILTPQAAAAASPSLTATTVTSTTSTPANATASPGNLDVSSSEAVHRPRSGSLKSDDSPLGGIPAPPPLPTKQRRTVRGNGGGVNGSPMAPQTPPLQPIKLSGRQDSLGSMSPTLGTQDGQTGSILPMASLSPLVTSQLVSTSSNNLEPIPLAIAVVETCNALFKGVELENSVVKVTGEVAMCFQSAYLAKLSGSTPLQFKVVSKGMEVEKLLHNQHLLKKADGDENAFVFIMPSLMEYLEKMQQKDSLKSYYNIQILKYEFKLAGGGSKMPLQLKSYMKCEPTATNYRLDYSFHPTCLFTSNKKPTLSKVVFSVPMDGGVQNVLSKPDGSWSAEKGALTWTVGEVGPSESSDPVQLQAKFRVTNGPSHLSKAVVTFDCEGASVSGLGLELQGSGYKVYLFKERCQAGQYFSEPKM